MERSGEIPNCSRYHLAPGSYHLTTFEQKLTRYVKFVLRTEGKATVTRPRLLEDPYPDGRKNSFSCSDGELNRIYEAARRTLRLCTLDIYMELPPEGAGRLAVVIPSSMVRQAG